MKEIEITLRVFNTLEEVDKILKAQGFKIKETYRLEDIYMKKTSSKLCKRNILKVLNNSILIRHIIEKDKENILLTYKKKEYKNKKLLAETKYNIKINDIDSAYNFFLQIGFEKLIDVNSTLIVYTNEEIELCFQNVDNLGLLLEVESNKNYIDSSDEEIEKEKTKMSKNLKKYGLNLSNDYNVKKAYELIKKELFEK